jgi:hypothetical protein
MISLKATISGRGVLPHWVKVAVIAFVLLMPSVWAPAANAAPANPAATRVFLMRGVLNIFSLGMDEIASRLQAQGIPAEVSNHMLWEAVADEAAADYKSGRIHNIVLVGHSSGATVLPDMVARLSQRGVPVALAIGLDSVFQTSLQGRVGRYINLYVANGSGTRVAATKGFHGTLENVNVDTVPGVGHLTIDKNEVIQRKVMAEIDAVAFGRTAARPVAAPAPQ